MPEKKEDKKVEKTVKFLTKEDLTKEDDLKVQEISVPEWGGKVRMKEMNGDEHDEFETFCGNNVEVVNGVKKVTSTRLMKAKVLSITIKDEADKRILSVEDLEAFNKKSGVVLDRLWEVARDMNALSEEKAEEIRKNS